MMASFRIKMRSVQIPITIETKNSNIAFEYILVLNLSHSIMEVVGSLKVLPDMNMEKRKGHELSHKYYINVQCQCHK